MAGGPATLENPLQATHLSLSCASCGDEVEEVKCLPCLHSLPLCDKAACQQKGLQRGVSCQQCLHTFAVPAGGFAPHPFAGRQAVSKQCQETEVFCHEDHDEPQKAVSYCPQCPGAICEECVRFHKSKKALKTHSVLSLDHALREGRVIPKETFKCIKHSEKQRLYCLECDELICPLCHSVGSHKSHSVLFVDGEIGEKNKSTLKSCVASAESNISKTKLALAQLKNSIEVLHQEAQTTRAEITEVINHVIGVLSARQAALVGEVDQLEERAGMEFQRLKERLNERLTDLEEFKLLTEDLLIHGIPEEQICLKKSVVQRIAAITAAPFSASGPPSSIHFDSSAVKENFEVELSRLGALMCGASPQNCTMENLPAPVGDGVLRIRSMPLTFLVITRDEDSKPCQGGDKVLATLSPSTCGVRVVGRVEETAGGSYQVQFDTLPASQCQLSVTVNGGLVRGSPLIVREHMVHGVGKAVTVFRDPSVQRTFCALTVGRDGNLLATDNTNMEVCVFDNRTGVVKHFHIKGAGTGMDGIVEMPERNIAVSNYDNNCIKVYTPNGEFVQEFNVSGGPSGLAVNAKGQLFVAEFRHHKVSVFDQSGLHQYSFGSEGQAPGQFKDPDQICIAPDGLVYVTSGGLNRVKVYKQNGTFVRQFGKGVLRNPTGVAVMKDGHVAVASWASHKISFFTTEGQCVHEVTDIGLNCPYSMAVDACGWLYVADCDNHRILKL